MAWPRKPGKSGKKSKLMDIGDVYKAARGGPHGGTRLLVREPGSLPVGFGLRKNEALSSMERILRGEGGRQANAEITAELRQAVVDLGRLARQPVVKYDPGDPVLMRQVSLVKRFGSNLMRLGLRKEDLERMTSILGGP